MITTYEHISKQASTQRNGEKQTNQEQIQKMKRYVISWLSLGKWPTWRTITLYKTFIII